MAKIFCLIDFIFNIICNVFVHENLFYHILMFVKVVNMGKLKRFITEALYTLHPSVLSFAEHGVLDLGWTGGVSSNFCILALLFVSFFMYWLRLLEF